MFRNNSEKAKNNAKESLARGILLLRGTNLKQRRECFTRYSSSKEKLQYFNFSLYQQKIKRVCGFSLKARPDSTLHESLPSKALPSATSIQH